MYSVQGTEEEGQGVGVPSVVGDNDAPMMPTVYQFQVEKIRLYAYLGIWGVCLFAVLVTGVAVKDNLGPFPLTEGAEPTNGLHCSILMETFGFNNICVIWDYSPAKEATALVYPVFEYLLIAYVIVTYLQTTNNFHNKKLSARIRKLSQIFLFFKIVLISWFRMIFVCSIQADPIPIFGTMLAPAIAHSLGFFGLQFALIIVAFEDLIYIHYKGVSMWGMSVDVTKKMVAVYFTIFFITTCLKISWASSVFINGDPWISGSWPQIFDRAWMVLAGFMPLLFSVHGIRNEPEIMIQITEVPRVLIRSDIRRQVE